MSKIFNFKNLNLSHKTPESINSKISTKVCKVESGRFQNVAMTLVGLSLVAVKCRNIEIERG